MSDTDTTVVPAGTIPARDDAGHFLPGQSGNPKGRPPGRRAQIDILKQNLEIAVRRGIRADRVAKIVEKMCDLAENGDVKAAKLILSMSVSTAAAPGDAGDNQGGITINIVNATFAAKAANTEKPIEGRVIEVEEMASDKSGQQHREQDTSGGNIVGKGPTDQTLHQPPDFMGQSGKPDNQNTNRPKGTT